MPDPEKVDLTLNSIPFKIESGVYSIALSKKNRDGGRTAYYHPVSSYKEYSITTDFLKNAVNGEKKDFKYIGDRGEKSQSGMHVFDERSNVIFFTQLQKNAISCWNTEKPLKESTAVVVTTNDATLVYPTDIKVDNLNNLWFLSNKFPIIGSSLETTELNFFVFKRNIRKLIDGTVCKSSEE